MTQNTPEDTRSPALSFWGYCEYFFGPIQSQLFLASVFFLPFAIRFLFDSGILRPDSLVLRGLTSAFCLFLLYITYRQICKIAGIPAAIGRHVGSESS